MAIEQPAYIVQIKQNAAELREYAPIIVAEVTVDGNREEAVNKGFRLLAGYIFGSNQTRASIAMTAPVTTTPASQKIAMTAPVMQAKSGNLWAVRFTMPSKYTMETLPIPNDARVKLIELPPQKFAVVRFSGFTMDGDIKKQTELLNDFVKNHKFQTIGEPILARFDPPWTPFFMRHNEMMIEVK